MRLTRIAPFMVLVFALSPSVVRAQCFGCCFTAPPRFAERLDNDTAVLASWVRGTADTEKSFGWSEFEIVEIFHQPAFASKDEVLDERTLESVNRLHQRTRLTLSFGPKAEPGDLFLLTASLEEGQLDWNRPVEMSLAAYDYCRKAPKQGEPAAKRLPYFVNHLDSEDSIIVDDVLLELGAVSHEELAQIAGEVPRRKLRKVLSSKEWTPACGWCGLLLGMRGMEMDADLLKRKILLPGEREFRQGLDEAMIGYLMLTGDDGLSVLDEKFLRAADVVFSDQYAVMQAIRYLWNTHSDRVAPDRLRQSMRLLLTKAEVADLVIADLARMKDWSVQDRLMELYAHEDYSVPSVKRAIVRYMMNAANDHETTDGNNENTSPSLQTSHAVQAQKHLAELEKRDPGTFKKVSQVFEVVEAP